MIFEFSSHFCYYMQHIKKHTCSCLIHMYNFFTNFRGQICGSQRIHITFIIVDTCHSSWLLINYFALLCFQNFLLHKYGWRQSLLSIITLKMSNAFSIPFQLGCGHIILALYSERGVSASDKRNSGRLCRSLQQSYIM